MNRLAIGVIFGMLSVLPGVAQEIRRTHKPCNPS